MDASNYVVPCSLRSWFAISRPPRYFLTLCWLLPGTAWHYKCAGEPRTFIQVLLGCHERAVGQYTRKDAESSGLKCESSTTADGEYIRRTNFDCCRCYIKLPSSRPIMCPSGVFVSCLANAVCRGRVQMLLYYSLCGLSFPREIEFQNRSTLPICMIPRTKLTAGSGGAYRLVV